MTRIPLPPRARLLAAGAALLAAATFVSLTLAQTNGVRPAPAAAESFAPIPAPYLRTSTVPTPTFGSSATATPKPRHAIPKARVPALRPSTSSARVPPVRPTTSAARPPAPKPAPAAAVLAQASARPAPKPAPATSRGLSHPEIAVSVLSMINDERRANGRLALTMSSRLVTSAHAHNLAMAQANTMSHQLPGEAPLGDRVLAAGYNYHYAGENIGFNGDMSTAGADQLETIMYGETPPNDGHRRNILSPNFKQAGVDVWFDTVHHRLWLTVDFGTSF